MENNNLCYKQIIPVAFGIHKSNADWIPQSPRLPTYINEFRPTIQDHWAADLRISSSIESGLRRHREQEANKSPQRKYYTQRGPSPEVNRHKERFSKLIQGGEASHLVKSELILEEGQVFRPCRLFYGNKKPAMSSRQKKKKLLQPKKEIAFQLHQSTDSEEASEKKKSSKKVKRVFVKPFMKFEDSQQEEVTKEQELWSGVAFAICSKNRQDLKELVKKVDDYRSTGDTNPNEVSRVNKKASNLSSRIGESQSRLRQAPSNLRVGLKDSGNSALSRSRQGSAMKEIQSSGTGSIEKSTAALMRQKSGGRGENLLSVPAGRGLAALLNINEANFQILSEEAPAPLDNLINQMRLLHIQYSITDNNFKTFSDNPTQDMHIEEGKTHRNGGQQFYESLIRQQKIISELVKHKAQDNLPQRQQTYRSDQRQIRNSVQLSSVKIPIAKMHYFNTREYDPKVMASPVASSQRITSQTMHGQQYALANHRAKLGFARSMRISAAGIETAFTSPTSFNNLLTHRSDINTLNDPLDQDENYFVQEGDVQTELEVQQMQMFDDQQTLRATARSSGIQNLFY